MDIVSFTFLAFAAVVIALYFLIPRRYQWIVILAGNIVFYCSFGARYLLYIVGMSLLTWWAALVLESVRAAAGENKKALRADKNNPALLQREKQLKQRKLLVLRSAVIVTLGIWILLKYGSFITENLNALVSLAGTGRQIPEVSWVAPIGMSFYTFHQIGYLIEVNKGKVEPERNYFKYFTFVSFFPHIIQGPFSRYRLTGISILEEHSFSWDRMTEGCRRILWGIFKKVVVADKIGIPINTILASYRDYTGLYLLYAIFLYSIQVYADFSGYMDIMCGICKILGIELAENFERPYFARNVDEFWRRWHITLGTWFRDYVFYPISLGKLGSKIGKWARKKFGAKKGKLVPGYFAMLFVWAATGLWHGASWNFLVWGYLNLFTIMISMLCKDGFEAAKSRLHIGPESKAWNVFCIIRTFFLVSVFRFFSTAPDLHTALSRIKRTVTALDFSRAGLSAEFFPGLTKSEILFALAGIAAVFIVDLISEFGKWEKCKQKTPMIVRNICYSALLLAILLIAGGNNDLVGGFIYADF